MSAAIEPVWIVYDGRAILGSTDDASVMESFGVDSARTDEQAIKYAKRSWAEHEFALYRYDLFSKGKKREARNERLIYVGTI